MKRICAIHVPEEYIMKNILKNPKNAERLLQMTSDAMLLLDEDGVCLEVSDYNARHWFLKEEYLVGKNVFRLMPDTEARREFHLEFVHSLPSCFLRLKR